MYKHLNRALGSLALAVSLGSCSTLDPATLQAALTNLDPTNKLLEPVPLANEGGFSGKGKAEPVTGSYFVSFGTEGDFEQLSGKVKEAGAKVKQGFKFIRTVEIEQADANMLGKLKAFKEVARITPNYTVKIAKLEEVSLAPQEDPAGKPSGQPSPAPAGQVVPAGVQRIGAAPGSLAQTGNGIGIAIVDTGIDMGHQDLNVSTACFSSQGTACQDEHGHGTHVAGIAAARNNSADVVGVAPGATLYAVRVLDRRGSGTDSDVIAGLAWIHQQAGTLAPAVKVVNMSLGRPLGSEEDINDSPMRRAIQALYSQNVSVVVAAGNEATREVSQNVPATFPEAIAIASSTAQDGNSCNGLMVARDTSSYFTTDGRFDPDNSIGVTISAPGEEKEMIIKNCRFLSSTGILSTRLGGGTTRMSGTSMASPHAAGVAALLYEKAGGALAPETVRQALRSRADRQGQVPLDSPTGSYTFDGEREGILYAPGTLAN